MNAKRLAAAALFGLIGFLAILSTAGSASVTWDEAIYIRSTRRYMTWLDILRRSPSTALSRATMTEYWGVAVPEQSGAGRVEDIHPPLVKLAAGVAWRLLRGLTGELVALRIVGAAMFGLSLAVLFLWIGEAYGLLAGTAAALSLGLMPRFFAYSNLLALDAPLATLTLVATYVYWKTIDRPGLPWTIPFGVIWGLALGSKNGGWLLPLGLAVWTLFYYHTWQHVLRLVVSFCVAVAVFIATWPWLYHDTISRLASFASFAFLGHADLLSQFTYYLGSIYQKPPWHYPLVMTVAVLPTTITLLIVAGAAGVIGDGRNARTGWLLVLSVVAPMLPFLLRIVAAYDGERLFLASFPFLAALAGVGFVRMRDGLWNWLWRHVPHMTARRQNLAFRSTITALLLVAVFIPPAVSIARLHPHELAYYSATVGGIRGAARLGLETTFWADSYQSVLDYVNLNAEPKSIVWADAYQVLWTYQELGRLRRDIVVPGADTPEPSGADLAIVQARQSRYFPAVASLMASRRPEIIKRVDGVALVMVYRAR